MQSIMYIYIYIYREREREREIFKLIYMVIYISAYMLINDTMYIRHLYIYIYISLYIDI